MPNIQVELYSTFYASWVDVSQYLMTDQGVSIKRGRGTRFDTSGVGTCAFVLDNFTGNFTPANSASPLGSTYGTEWASKNQQVRITIDSIRVFTGFVDSWSASVSSSGECLTTVTASDRMKFLGTNPLGGYGVERAKQIVGTNGVVYPLASAIGAGTTAQFSAWRDTSAGLLTISTAGMSAWEFVSDAPAFGSGSFHGVKNIDTGAGVGLRVPKTLDISTGGSSFGAFRLNPAAAGFHPLFFVAGSSSAYNAFLYIEPSLGNAVFSLTSYPSGTVYTFTSSVAKLNDDAWHTFVLVFASTGRLATLYIDGVNVGSVSSATTWALSPTGRANTFGAINNGNTAIDGYLSTIGVTSEVLTFTKANDLHDAIINGDSGDTITTRTQNVMKCLYPTGTPTIAIANASAITLAGQATNGQSAMSVLNEIADTERGIVYVDRLGDTKFRGSAARSLAFSLTFDALADLDGNQDCTLIADDSTFANRVLASGPAGSFIAENATSIATLGIISESWSCISTSLNGATDPPTKRLNDRLNVEPRIGQVTVDLMTATAVSKSSAVQIVPLDCVRFTNLPTQLGSATRSAIVEGYSLNASVSSYTLTLDLSPTG
jgi:hypothetical protein